MSQTNPNLRDLVVVYAESFLKFHQRDKFGATDMKDSLRTDMETTMSHVNDKLAIANLNKRILATGGSISAGDLQDQRDLVIQELAEVTGVTVRFSPNGQASVSLWMVTFSYRH